MLNPTIVGFTGTQAGLTGLQEAALAEVLDQFRAFGSCEVHHGDCVGGDDAFHRLATDRGFSTVVHPPVQDKKRAFCKGSVILPALPYLARNHMIVRSTTLLVACPSSLVERQRSGTWATWRFARHLGRPTVLIRPNGTTKWSSGGYL